MNTQLNLPDLLNAQGLVKCIDDALKSKRETLDELEGSQILFDPNENLIPINGWSNIDKTKIKSIEKIDKPSHVAAVDSSAIFIADTPKGSIYAVKSGIAIAYNRKPLTHFKIGPTLLYINESYDSKISKLALLDHSIVKRLIRIRVERALQNKLAESLEDSIILVDGSLKISLFEDSINHLDNIIENSRDNRNILIGISKVSRLKLIERLVSLLNNNDKPSYLDITKILRAYVSNLMGNQLLAKFDNGLVLRADTIDVPQQSLSLLLSNDSLHNGYPETLRLAHHLSIFTKTEVLATISIISSRYNLDEIDGCDARRVLLGKIGVK